MSLKCCREATRALSESTVAKPQPCLEGMKGGWSFPRKDTAKVFAHTEPAPRLSGVMERKGERTKEAI